MPLSLSNVTTRQYDAEGNETRTYDAASRLIPTTVSFLGEINYQFDLIGNRIKMIAPDSGILRYSYDGKNRLTSFTNPKGGKTI